MSVSIPLSGEDILYLSLAVNALLVLHALTSRLLDLVSYVLRGRSRLLVWVAEIHRTRPGLVARILSEQLSLWILVVVATVFLRHSPTVHSHPFLKHPAPYSVLLKIVLASSAARSLLLVGRLALAREIYVQEDHAKTRASQGLTGNTKADLAFAVVDFGSKLVCLAYKQNLFLGTTALFYEPSSSILECYRLLELLQAEFSYRTLRRTAVFHLIVFVICRVVLPIVFLVSALVVESPLVMSTVPVVWLFAAGAVHLTFHCFWLYQSIALALRPPPPAILPGPRKQRPNQSDRPTLDALSNDIHDGGDSASGKPSGGYSLFKGFDYIFLRSYDNRNVSPQENCKDTEKMNILRRKDGTKNTLVYKPFVEEFSQSREKIPPTGGVKSDNSQSDFDFATDDSLLSSQSHDSQENVPAMIETVFVQVLNDCPDENPSRESRERILERT